MQKVRIAQFIFLLIVLLFSSVIAADKNFYAELSGSEVMPSVKTTAKGMATFQIVKEGKEMTYKLTVTDIENVTAAHIHEGKYGKNGPPVVSLFAGPKKEGKFSGTLSEGIITVKDLSGSLKGKSFDQLIWLIEAEHAYVNVHTEKNPGGEIRGQILSHIK
ncbi:MAG: CHRD domain-containing protein [Nitrospirota bacterium]